VSKSAAQQEKNTATTYLEDVVRIQFVDLVKNQFQIWSARLCSDEKFGA
jgi:hypothetical protein